MTYQPDTQDPLGAGPRRGLIGHMGDESRLCGALAPIPFEPPKPVAAVSLQPRNDTTPERWIQAGSLTEEAEITQRHSARPGMAKAGLSHTRPRPRNKIRRSYMASS